MDRATDRIVPLDELKDFKVAEGDPDVRGWEVLSADGRKIGDVDNLLVDTAAMKVRYLDVDIDDEHITDGTDRHILIPIGYARLDESDDQIFVDSLNTANLSQIPAYRHELLTREYETDLRQHFDSDFTGTTGTDFYSHDLYNQDRFFGNRRTGTPGLTQPTDETSTNRFGTRTSADLDSRDIL
jgi:photosynthetic reaction center H subunit